MPILVNSSTKKMQKNYWATTRECFADAQALYGRKFKIDVAATPLTKKCDLFFSEHENSLTTPWLNDWWCNPPFDNKFSFLEWAYIQKSIFKTSGMALIPFEPCTGWWARYVDGKASVVYEPDGRYPFLESDGKTKKSGVNFASCFVLFSPIYTGETLRVRFKRGIRLTNSISIGVAA
ncbi:DNA N-6-adenine-methyltransferase [Catenovulum sediminis]